MTPPPHPLHIGKEYPPPGEDVATQKLRALHLQVQHATGGDSRRGEHPKTHCGVWATFRVEENLPQECRVGIFAKSGLYTALVRFSNGRNADDRLPDVRAMAIKVLIPQETGDPFQQDFLLTNHAVFFAKDVQGAFDFLAATAGGVPVAQLAMTTFPALIGFTGTVSKSLLALTYWSQTPYKFGDGAVKYLLVPQAETTNAGIPIADSPDFIVEAITEQLTARKLPAVFDFCVNPQTDPVTEPIEDPTVEWKSAPIKLATISLYPQKFDAAAQMTFVENLVWSPWNCLPDHKALGGINRARQLVYQDSKDRRHTTNGVTTPIITGRESF
jgi:hypothetical protein